MSTQLALAPNGKTSALGTPPQNSLAGLHLLNRVGEPAEVTNAALYLLASDFVTGIELRVDGGTRAGRHLS